jgi:transcriptional regulator with XRE-family HTH domain
MGRVIGAVQDMALADELQRLRIGAGLTQHEAGRRVGWSSSRISRVENCMTTIRLSDLPGLLEAYSATPEQQQQAMLLAKRATKIEPVPRAPSSSKLDEIIHELRSIRLLLEKGQGADDA